MLGIVYGVLNSTVFSAKSVAQSYLTAIADGKYGKANGIADPQVDKDQLKLLSDTVAKADNATIANPHIDSVKTVEGVAKVNVTYSLNGKNVNDSLTINKDGSKFLLFPNWKISSPLLKTITVSVPNAVESLSVNGVDVTAKNAEKSDRRHVDAARLPGFVQGVDRQVGVCHQRHHHGAHERGLRCRRSQDHAYGQA